MIITVGGEITVSKPLSDSRQERGLIKMMLNNIATQIRLYYLLGDEAVAVEFTWLNDADYIDHRMIRTCSVYMTAETPIDGTEPDTAHNLAAVPERILDAELCNLKSALADLTPFRMAYKLKTKVEFDSPDEERIYRADEPGYSLIEAEEVALRKADTLNDRRMEA